MSTRFHSGEIALQQATGAYERLAGLGARVIRDFMPDQHRELFAKLPTLFVGSMDDAGCVWASVVAGAPGFISTPSERMLRVTAPITTDDPAAAGMKLGAPIGLLGLEPHTRRRNRANGVIAAVDQQGFALEVKQSFGNCPKYIYAREPSFVTDRVPGIAQHFETHLSDAALGLIASSDTLFIASSSSQRFATAIEAGAGVDVSHRGGPQGFVAIDRMASADRLTMPDYVGNYMFNTLGNCLLWPVAGLLFVDWQNGDLLQLSVNVHLQTEGAEIAAIPGARRLVHMTVMRGVFRPRALALTWSEAQAPAQFRMGGGD